MRQRKLKDLDERMKDLADYLDLDGKQNKGQWRHMFAQQMIAASGEIAQMMYYGVLTEEEIEESLYEEDSKLCLEIGCGKGKFMCERAAAFPDSMMIGIEGQESVIVRAAEKVRMRGLWNTYLISGYVRDIHDFFEDGELDGIFLNFSDPWPKARHARRRLTCRENLEAYMDVVRDGGFIEFKTDNDELFAFTMEEIEALGYEIDEMSEDLHAGSDVTAGSNAPAESDAPEENDAADLDDDDEPAFDGAAASVRFRTEYEEKFMKKGVKIKFVRIVK